VMDFLKMETSYEQMGVDVNTKSVVVGSWD
jgi:hypothetical protein